MDARQLARVARVRNVQLTLARAAQANAQAQVLSETTLHTRVAQLAAAVAPAPETGGAVSLSAAAHYRDRLHQSAATAQARVVQAEHRAAAAATAAQGAERDLKAVEKLQDRVATDAARMAMRALEAMPASPRPNRHDPC